MTETVSFTAAEAAFVLRLPLKTVQKALDDGPVQPMLISNAGRRVRAIDRSDLLYIFAVGSLREDLTPKGRRAFYHALKGLPHADAREVRVGRLAIAIDDLRTEVESRMQALVDLGDKVEFRADGDALLAGTTIEVYRIAALLAGGMTVDEICEDYPSLDRASVAVAKAYADAHPKPGRPYPRTTLKRALADAGLEALDEVFDEEA